MTDEKVDDTVKTPDNILKQYKKVFKGKANKASDQQAKIAAMHSEEDLRGAVAMSGVWRRYQDSLEENK